MRKVATFQFSAIEGLNLDGGKSMVKLASSGSFASSESAKKVIRAEIEKHPSALFFRAKAIEADIPNNNGDCFSKEELKKSCDTFIGVPFFTNHENQDIEKAKGKVVWSEWDDEDNAIYIVAFVDTEAYPNLCRGIGEGYMTGVSMGCSVEYSNCSICKNRAATMDEYCSHIRNFKGRNWTGRAKDVNTGQTVEHKNASVHEDNYGIRFIELSGVADPACPACHIDTIYDGESFCGKTAAIGATSLIKAASKCYNEFSTIKYAVLEKEASQSQIDSLNSCLQTLEQVSVSLIQNRANVEMEFASDIVEILAGLQDFVDQLVQAGYGQLPETGDQPVPGTLPEEVAGVQPVSAEEGLEPGSSNVEEPLLAEPAAPNMDAFNEATRPSPSTSTGKLTRPTSPVRAKKAEEDNKNMRRLPKKSAGDRERAKQVLSENWQGKLDEMSSNLSNVLKNDPSVIGSTNGGQKMANDNTVEAKSSHTDLHEITEKQLEKANVGANPREEKTRDGVTQCQLDELRKGEPEVITESQLETTEGANPRENDEKEVITEKQLDESKGANPREDKELDEITQAQLDTQRVDKEPDVITEAQLSNPPTDTPWERSCSNSVPKHIEASATILAKAAVVSGETPESILKEACSMLGQKASERLALANEIWNADPNSESVSAIVAKAKFWNSKNIKVAAVEMTAKEAIIAFASEAVCSDSLNPELLIESFGGIRDNDATYMIDDQIEKVATASEDDEEETQDIRAEMGDYFTSKKSDGEEEDEEGSVLEETEEIVEAISDENTKVADHVVEASVAEVGCEDLEGEELKTAAATFARGACSAHGMRMASLINVTVEDDVVTIAVETENESVEIPIGNTGADIEEEPIEDLGEAGEVPPIDELAPIDDIPPVDDVPPVDEMAPAPPAGQEDILGLASSTHDKMSKESQFGGGNAEVPGGQGAGAASPEDLATAPDMMPDGGGIQSFTGEEEPLADEEELPGGEQQEAGTICPICNSNDTETGNKDQQPGQFDCNNCGAKYTMHVNVDVLNPEELYAGSDMESIEDLESPEVPEMPVAAFVDLGKNNLSKYASDVKDGVAYCPGCGDECEIEGELNSNAVKCASCGTSAQRDIIVDLDDPKTATLKVEWNILPRARKCAGCNDARKAFASDYAFRRMVKAASKKEFPVEKATAWIEREFGTDTVVSYGENKGDKLAETVVKQLQSFGLEKIKYMKRLCEVQTQEDPMTSCLSMHKKNGFTVAESTRLCNCIKDKYASEQDNNLFMAAFAGMIDNTILRKMAEHITPKVEEAVVESVNEDDMLISDIKIEASKNEAEETVTNKIAGDKKLKQTVVEKEDDIPNGDGHMGREKETIPTAKEPDVPRANATMGEEKPPADKEVSVPVDMQYLGEEEPVGEKEISTKTLGIVASDENAKSESHMSDGGPGEKGKGVAVVEDIESSDDVPRGDAKMGNEQPPADKSPEVPRGDATMGSEESCNCDEPTVPHGADAEKVEMRGRVAASDQHDKLAQKRREKAVRIAAGLVGRNAVQESEFEEVVSDLVNLPLDRMEAYANRIMANTSVNVKTASTLTAPVVMEDRGIRVEEPKSLQDELAGLFTIGSKKATKYIRDGDVEE